MAFSDTSGDRRPITSKQADMLETKAKITLGLRSEAEILDWLEFEMDPGVKVYRLEDLTREQMDRVMAVLREREGA